MSDVHAQLPHSGKIKMFKDDKGWGFIENSEGGDDTFFHVSACGNLEPRVGMKVDFSIEKGRDGRMKAGQVVAAG